MPAQNIKDLTKYENKWVALVKERIVAAGKDAFAAHQQALKRGYKDFTFSRCSPLTAIISLTTMKFEYKKVPSSPNPADPWVSKPYLTIRLSAAGKTVQLDALIDSGAETSLFHSSVAKVFGLDLKAGLKKEYYGITGEPATCYFHPVRLQVVGLSHSIDLAVAFTDASSVGALLGQADFFEHFKITFERYKERLEITPKGQGR